MTSTYPVYQLKRLPFVFSESSFGSFLVRDQARDDLVKLFRDSSIILKQRVQDLTNIKRITTDDEVSAIHIMTEALAETKLRLGKE